MASLFGRRALLSVNPGNTRHHYWRRPLSTSHSIRRGTCRLPLYGTNIFRRLRETRPRWRGLDSGSAATAMAQFEYINHLASGTRLVACASTFQINFLFISMTRPTNICSASLRRAYSHGCMRVEYPDKYAEVTSFNFSTRGRVIPFSAFARSMAKASGISI